MIIYGTHWQSSSGAMAKSGLVSFPDLSSSTYIARNQYPHGGWLGHARLSQHKRTGVGCPQVPEMRSPFAPRHVWHAKRNLDLNELQLNTTLGRDMTSEP